MRQIAVSLVPKFYQELVWHTTIQIRLAPFFERSSKRRKGFPSETRVKRGLRIVHGDRELSEKLGSNNLCPCGSGRSFQTMLPCVREIGRKCTQLLLSANKERERICSQSSVS